MNTPLKGKALEEIERRTNAGKELASRFPELKGVSFAEFLEKCPLDLDFITANEMYEALQD